MLNLSQFLFFVLIWGCLPGVFSSCAASLPDRLLVHLSNSSVPLETSRIIAPTCTFAWAACSHSVRPLFSVGPSSFARLALICHRQVHRTFGLSTELYPVSPWFSICAVLASCPCGHCRSGWTVPFGLLSLYFLRGRH